MRGMTIGMRLLTAAGLSTPGALVTHRSALEDIGEAFETAVDKPDGFVKATVTFRLGAADLGGGAHDQRAGQHEGTLSPCVAARSRLSRSRQRSARSRRRGCGPS